MGFRVLPSSGSWTVTSPLTTIPKSADGGLIDGYDCGRTAAVQKTVVLVKLYEDFFEWRARAQTTRS